MTCYFLRHSSPSRASVRGFAKGWFPKGWFWRMFPYNKNRNEGTKHGMTVPKTGTRAEQTERRYEKPERGRHRQNRPFTKPPFHFLSICQAWQNWVEGPTYSRAKSREDGPLETIFRVPAKAVSEVVIWGKRCTERCSITLLHSVWKIRKVFTAMSCCERMSLLKMGMSCHTVEEVSQVNLLSFCGSLDGSGATTLLRLALQWATKLRRALEFEERERERVCVCVYVTLWATLIVKMRLGARVPKKETHNETLEKYCLRLYLLWHVRVAMFAELQQKCIWCFWVTLGLTENLIGKIRGNLRARLSTWEANRGRFQEKFRRNFRFFFRKLRSAEGRW